MENEDKTANVPVSNWTRATGTKPFERYVYFATPPDNSSQHPVPPQKGQG